MNRIPCRIAILTCVAALIGCTWSHTLAPVERGGCDVSRDGNVAYHEDVDLLGNQRTLDVFQPEGVSDAPVLMYVHGGAWTFGSKTFIQHIGRTFAKRGIVTVLVNYRLSPVAKHPDHIRDVARAFDWVKRNIDRYGGDPENVFVAGHSAGGHLVSLLALNERYLAEVGRSSDEITGVVSISGLYRVGGTSLVFKNTFPSSEAGLVDASPEFHVDDAQPPFLILYAEDDFPFLDVQAIGFKRTLDRYDSPARMRMIADRNHHTMFRRIGRKNDPTTAAMLTFIDENVQGK